MNPDSIQGQALHAAPSTQEHLHVDQSVIDRVGALTTGATAIQRQGESFHLMVPAGFQHSDITALVEKANPTPNRRRGTVTLCDIESFNNFVTEQAIVGASYIYADPEARTLTAVLNDHAANDGPVAIHGWRDYRAVYKAELSREFTIWLNNNKQPKDQEDFAIFLEDNIADVVDPSGESLLAIALTLQAKTEANFSSSRRLDNGQVQISYTENIDARASSGNIEIPREFAIGCRLFKNGEGYKIRARLKYRLNGGTVKFWYELDRAENVIEDAFEAYVEQARESGLTVLIGKP